MSTNAVWSKRLRASFLALVVIVIAMCSCDLNDQCGKPIVSGTQICDSCNFITNELQLVDAIPTDSFVFRKPVAIEYFWVATHPHWFDSTSDHQEYYRIMDQYGYYTEMMRGYVRSLNVECIDSITDRNVLFFEDDSNEYVVDVTRFLVGDGVLLWTPGKKPVLWTSEVHNQHCSDSTFVHCYFKK